MYTLLLAAALAADPKPNCKNPMTQSDMNICSWSEAQAADVIMKREWALVSAYMKEADKRREENPRGYDHGQKRLGYFAALLESQRAWLKYRDAECLIERYAVRGGSMEPLFVNQCFEQLTKDRTNQLQELLKAHTR